VKRELKWKSDAAAAAASSTSAGSSDATDHQQSVVRQSVVRQSVVQQSVVRSCISRLRRGSDLKKAVTSRLPRATGAAVPAKPSSVEEEEEKRK